jgi:acyl carrier protein
MDTLTPAMDLAYPALAAVFEEVFQHPGPLTRETSPVDVPRWDSLQHIALVSTIERTFGVSLSMDEMMEMRSVGAIEAVLRRHGV